jgi:hypothetical protein
MWNRNCLPFRSTPDFSGVRIAQSLVFCVMFCWSLFIIIEFRSIEKLVWKESFKKGLKIPTGIIRIGKSKIDWLIDWLIDFWCFKSKKNRHCNDQMEKWQTTIYKTLHKKLIFYLPILIIPVGIFKPFLKLSFHTNFSMDRNSIIIFYFSK